MRAPLIDLRFQLVAIDEAVNTALRAGGNDWMRARARPEFRHILMDMALTIACTPTASPWGD